jgi:hypothetical protein
MNEQSTRAELLDAVAELGRLFPDMRLGQMLENLAMQAGRMESGAVYDLEDDEALAAARQLIEYNSARRLEPAPVSSSVSPRDDEAFA